MAATNISQQLKDYIQTMQDQGILDHEFDEVKRLHRRENPQFIINLITIFKNDAQHYIALLTSFLNEADVDFSNVKTFAHQLKVTSSSIGGRRVSHAALQLQNASENNNKQRCLELFEIVKQEYNTLQECFNTIYQMETNIIVTGSSETRRRRFLQS